MKVSPKRCSPRPLELTGCAGLTSGPSPLTTVRMIGFPAVIAVSMLMVGYSMALRSIRVELLHVLRRRLGALSACFGIGVVVAVFNRGSRRVAIVLSAHPGPEHFNGQSQRESADTGGLHARPRRRKRPGLTLPAKHGRRVAHIACVSHPRSRADAGRRSNSVASFEGLAGGPHVAGNVRQSPFC